MSQAEYPKIDSLYKRHPSGSPMLFGVWARPEFEYLSHNLWVATEKVDGTNIRACWDGTTVKFDGRKEASQIPTFLYDRLVTLFGGEQKDYFRAQFPDGKITVFGEGYGARIQKSGDNYIPGGVDFVVFDIQVGELWLEREDIEDIASHLGLRVVPVVATGTLEDLERLIAPPGLNSVWGAFPMEGFVAKPQTTLLDRQGRRIITKLKTKDFK